MIARNFMTEHFYLQYAWITIRLIKPFQYKKKYHEYFTMELIETLKPVN